MFGIAIATYNRVESLRRLLDNIEMVSAGRVPVIVCNDGSTDNTLAMCCERGINVIGNKNRGISWNKNRGLFWLMEHTSVDRLLLLEDDIVITEPDWLSQWAKAVDLWGHVTWANEDLVRSREDRYIAGAGEPESPYVLKYVTGQVMGFTRRALKQVGYFDTRFHGYGYEHIDLSRRLHRAGYGMIEVENVRTKERENGYVNIIGGITTSDLPTVSDRSTTEQNRQVYEALRGDTVFRHAWINDGEREELLAEVAEVLSPTAERRAG